MLTQKINRDTQPAHRPSADVIVCVHNSLLDVRLCLQSLAGTDWPEFRIIGVDDGSDEETKSFLNEFFSESPTDLLIPLDTGGSYTKAANAGLRASTADYAVLLNSDTIVSKCWLERIIACGERAPDIGIVGPLSNAASWQSVPRVKNDEADYAINALPEGMDVDQMADLCKELSSGVFPRVPLLNGFCFAIKRAVIDAVGYLDEASFPTGYGEEDDFCFRAVDAGFMGSIATHAYVFHSKSKSFSHERRIELSRLGGQALRRKYTASRIGNAVATMRHQPELARIREALQHSAGNIETASVPPATPPEPTDREPSGQVATGTNLKSTDRRVGRAAPNPLVVGYDASLDALARNREIVEAFRANPQLDLKRALWLMPAFDHVYRGGVYTILRVADSFSRRFGTLNVLALHKGTQNQVLRLQGVIQKAFPNLKFELVAIADTNAVEDLPATDAGFCTLWTCAYLLLHYKKCRAKFYFLQDFEPAFYAAGSVYGVIEQTYRFGFNGIANTPGIGEVYRQYNPWVDYFIPGVDRTVFNPSPFSQASTPLRIVFYGRPNKDRNAFQLGTEALRLVKQELGAGVEILSAGSEFSTTDFGLEHVMINRGLIPTIDEVASLYRACDVGLVFMYTPHPSYQPLEYMASGCVTVTNFNRHTGWLLKNGINAVLTESTVTCVAERILEALRDTDLRKRVIAGGLETVSTMDWEDALDRIANCVRHPAPRHDPFVTPHANA